VVEFEDRGDPGEAVKGISRTKFSAGWLWESLVRERGVTRGVLNRDRGQGREEAAYKGSRKNKNKYSSPGTP
jgi:hypothetical protein